MQTQLILLPFKPDENLIFLTNRVGRQLSSLILAELDIDGYRPQSTHMAILADLYNEAAGLRQQDLAVSAIKDKATIARSLAQMEANGLVLRDPDPKDRRNKLISLTPKGRAIFTHFQPVKRQVMEVATQQIHPDDLAQCKLTLARIYHNLQVHINQPQDD